MYFIYL